MLVRTKVKIRNKFNYNNNIKKMKILITKILMKIVIIINNKFNK